MCEAHAPAECVTSDVFDRLEEQELKSDVIHYCDDYYSAMDFSGPIVVVRSSVAVAPGQKTLEGLCWRMHDGSTEWTPLNRFLFHATILLHFPRRVMSVWKSEVACDGRDLLFVNLQHCVAAMFKTGDPVDCPVLFDTLLEAYNPACYLKRNGGAFRINVFAQPFVTQDARAVKYLGLEESAKYINELFENDRDKDEDEL